eukprot:COSAG02_NODE_1134_length_14376_cov_382.343700_3_plen_54_part_00
MPLLPLIVAVRRVSSVASHGLRISGLDVKAALAWQYWVSSSGLVSQQPAGPSH